MSNCRPVDRQTGCLRPPSVDDWLPEEHLAREVVEVIAQLETRAMPNADRGAGSASDPPARVRGVRVSGDATGVYSSRTIDRATDASVAGRFMAANDHPDPDTIATFRRRVLKPREHRFVDVLGWAPEMGLRHRGTVALDGTKRPANASRPSALSAAHAGTREAQRKAEVAALRALAEAADQADVPEGLSMPDALARREERLTNSADANATIDARARGRGEQEHAEHIAKRAAREARARATGTTPGGTPPPRRPVPGRGRRIRATAPTTSRAACRSRAAASSRPPTHRRRWPRAAWGSSPATWCRPPTTSRRSRRCARHSPGAPIHGATGTRGLPTPATAATRTCTPAPRRVWRR